MPVRFLGIGGAEDELALESTLGEVQGGGGSGGWTLERRMEMLRLHGEQMQRLADSISGCTRRSRRCAAARGGSSNERRRGNRCAALDGERGEAERSGVSAPLKWRDTVSLVCSRATP